MGQVSQSESQRPDIDSFDSEVSKSSDSDLEQESRHLESLNQLDSGDHLISENLVTYLSTKIHLSQVDESQ